MASYISANYVGHTVNPDPTLKQSRRVGGWVLEWEPHRPHTVWAIPEHLKTGLGRASSGIYYGADSTPLMGWDHPLPPTYVRQAALAFVLKCQTQHNAERGNQ